MFSRKSLSLVVAQGADAGKRVTLSGKTVTIGNGPSADLKLTDPHVLPLHAEVRRTGGRWIMTTEAPESTLVDGERARKVEIVEGSRIVLSNRVAIHAVQAEAQADPERPEEASDGEAVPVARIIRLVLFSVVIIGGLLWLLNKQAPSGGGSAGFRPLTGEEVSLLVSTVDQCIDVIAGEMDPGAAQTERFGPARLLYLAAKSARADGANSSSEAIELREITARNLNNVALNELGRNWEEARASYTAVLDAFPDNRCQITAVVTERFRMIQDF